MFRLPSREWAISSRWRASLGTQRPLLRTPNNHHHIAKLNPFSVVHLLISNFKLAFGVNWQSYWSRLAPVIGVVFELFWGRFLDRVWRRHRRYKNAATIFDDSVCFSTRAICSAKAPLGPTRESTTETTPRCCCPRHRFFFSSSSSSVFFSFFGDDDDISLLWSLFVRSKFVRAFSFFFPFSVLFILGFQFLGF